ncbi:MAG: hypothetical protein V4701_05000 [Pseudomonadota bacterium]
MLIVGLALLAIASDPRPPRPTDDDLRAAAVAERPGSALLSLEFRDSNRGGGRIGCALVDIDGTVEPVSVITVWRDARQTAFVFMGEPRVVAEAAGWAVNVIGPTRTDHTADGEIGWADRSNDNLSRRMALQLCPDLAPPAGEIWETELEPNPDPARGAEARRRARATADIIFGPDRSTPEND